MVLLNHYQDMLPTSSPLKLCCWGLLCLCLALASCAKPEQRQAQPSFYHWQTRLELGAGPRALTDSLGCQRLYAKFFDVDWDEEYGNAVPLAEIQLVPGSYAGLELVPTVFITNRTLERLPAAERALVAQRIRDKLFDLARQDPALRLGEVQLDCDWTQGTREAYFELLRQVRALLEAEGIRLSATIRLHQVRHFEQTGVPPVERGILMFYNIGDLEDWEEPNSILNLDKAEPYLQGFERYPLPLGLALPLFRWGVLFRDGRMIRLLNNLDAARLEGDARFRPLEPGRYEIAQGTFLDGHYLYAGDRLRLEKVDLPLLQKAASRLSRLPWPTDLELVFYHLDSLAAADFPAEALREIVRGF
jgi:hypothetical protein